MMIYINLTKLYLLNNWTIKSRLKLLFLKLNISVRYFTVVFIHNVIITVKISILKIINNLQVAFKSFKKLGKISEPFIIYEIV
jgi:hypothetical protein